MSLLLLFRPMSGVGGEPEPEPEPQLEPVRRRGRGHKYRIIEDPDRLLEQVKSEEKKVEKEKKKLKILVKQSSVPEVTGVLYQQALARIEVLEAKIDERLQKISELQSLIQMRFDEQSDDDEDALLLS